MTSNDVVLVLLLLNTITSSAWTHSFHCYLWTGKYQLRQRNKFIFHLIGYLTLLSPGGRSFLPTANLNLKYFWTVCALWFLNGLWLILTFTRDYFAGKKKIKISRVTYFFTGGIVKKQEFGYVGTVLVAELNISCIKSC